MDALSNAFKAFAPLELMATGLRRCLAVPGERFISNDIVKVIRLGSRTQV